MCLQLVIYEYRDVRKRQTQIYYETTTETTYEGVSGAVDINPPAGLGAKRFSCESVRQETPT